MLRRKLSEPAPDPSVANAAERLFLVGEQLERSRQPWTTNNEKPATKSGPSSEAWEVRFVAVEGPQQQPQHRQQQQHRQHEKPTALQMETMALTGPYFSLYNKPEVVIRQSTVDRNGKSPVRGSSSSTGSRKAGPSSAVKSTTSSKAKPAKSTVAKSVSVQTTREVRRSVSLSPERKSTSFERRDVNRPVEAPFCRSIWDRTIDESCSIRCQSATIPRYPSKCSSTVKAPSATCDPAVEIAHTPSTCDQKLQTLGVDTMERSTLTQNLTQCSASTSTEEAVIILDHDTFQQV